VNFCTCYWVFIKCCVTVFCAIVYFEVIYAYRILVGRPEGRRPLGRPKGRWEDNIKMDLKEVGWGAWTGLIWLRIVTGGGLL
jgi:hypothetical protein